MFTNLIEGIIIYKKRIVKYMNIIKKCFGLKNNIEKHVLLFRYNKSEDTLLGIGYVSVIRL